MRYRSIDIMRTLAIFVMVLVHFGENLSGLTLPIAGLGAPIFTFLTGISYFLWVSGKEGSGASDTYLLKTSIRRALFIFCAGFAFNILVWLPEDTFNWDVLTFIGFSLLFLALFRTLPDSVLLTIALVCLLISPVLRNLADYHSYWIDRYFQSDLTLSDLAIGFTTTGYFPIFPWLSFPIVGYVTGRRFFSTTEDTVDRGFLISEVPDKPEQAPNHHYHALTIGVASIVMSITLLLIHKLVQQPSALPFLDGWSMFPATVEYTLATLGMALVIFATLFWMVDLHPGDLSDNRFLRITKTFSRYSLTIYILHHIVHLWPLWIYGSWFGDEPTQYWRQAMPISVSIPLALLFMGICYFSLYRLGPDRRVGIESWMRWLCD